MPEARPVARNPDAAVFTEGSIARHVLIMSMTGAVGTMAVFFVDLADLYFLSLLGQTEVTAAVGFAQSILLFQLSVALGNGIAAGVLVSRSLGSGDTAGARDQAANAFLFAMLSSAVIAFLIAVFADGLLTFMGASGDVKHLAKIFIWTISPGYVLAAGSLCLAAILRSLGDPRRAMYVTLSTALIILALDPILILGLGWGIQGAAVATVLAEAAAFAVGLHGVVRVHSAFGPIQWQGLWRCKAVIWAIAYPAALSQMTIPLSNAYMTYLMAGFGDGAVAGFAIVCRLVPVAYGAVFALTSAVGPVIGQNFGAGHHARVREAITQSLSISTIYTFSMSLLLFVLAGQIATAFGAEGQSYAVVTFFCTFIGVSWAFTGAQFIASAAFNNLGHPRLAALFSWGRVGLGTVPFATVGAAIAGPEGVLTGNAIGALLFGSMAVAVAYRLAAAKQAVVDHA